MLLTNAKLATMTDASPYGIIDNGAIVIKHNKIEWVGETCNLPDNFKDLKHNGADVLVAGSYIFNSPDYNIAIDTLK